MFSHRQGRHQIQQCRKSQILAHQDSGKCQSQIQFFTGGRMAPDSPPNSRVRRSWKPSVKRPVFRVVLTLKHSVTEPLSVSDGCECDGWLWTVHSACHHSTHSVVHIFPLIRTSSRTTVTCAYCATILWLWLYISKFDTSSIKVIMWSTVGTSSVCPSVRLSRASNFPQTEKP